MYEKNISDDRRKYLRKIMMNKITIITTQILIVLVLVVLWEICANYNIIDSFITSQPTRILDTLKNLSTNGLLQHLWTTTYETLVGFLLGTALGIFIAIVLWWSKFLAKVAEPFLVVLNSLPKVALRANHNNLGRSWNSCNYRNGSCDIFSSNHYGNFEWFFRNR